MSNQTNLIDFIAELSSRDADITLHFYDLLRVHPNAEQEVIESAYRRLLRLYHPDVNKHPLAGDVTKVLIAAYGVLGDPVNRAEYDSHLAVVNDAATDRQGHQNEESDGEDEATHYFITGLDYAMKDEHILAIEAFTAAIRLAPSEGNYYGARGSVYRKLDKTDLALLDFDIALSAYPDDAMIYFERSYVHEKMENLDSAISDLSRAIELEPDPERFGDPVLRRRLARLMDDRATARVKRDSPLSPTTKWDGNIQKYTEAINLYPHRSSNYKFRGNAYLKIGDLELAIEDFNKAIELNPNSASNYEHRAKAYAEMGENQLAAVDRNTARRLLSGQHLSSSAKTRITSASSASSRTATNERVQTQPTGNYSAYSTQASSAQGTSRENKTDKADLWGGLIGAVICAVVVALVGALIVGYTPTIVHVVIDVIFLVLVPASIYGLLGGYPGSKRISVTFLFGVGLPLGVAGIFYIFSLNGPMAVETANLGFFIGGAAVFGFATGSSNSESKE